MAETLSSVQYNVGSNWTEITLTRISGSQTPPKTFQLDGDVPRLVVDWSDAVLTFNNMQGEGHVDKIRYAKKGDKGLRVVFDLIPGSNFAGQKVDADTIKLLLNGPQLQPVAPKITSRYFDNTIPFPRLQPRMNAKPRTKPVVVIDPGHGGKDPGAIGRKGTREKGITLKAAKTLRALLMETGRYNVILTRTDDTYIAHEERLRIARAGGGDLFISIHADSTKGHTARGASVYTLADRAQGRTKEVIDTQNWVMDVDLSAQSDPVGDILVDLAKRKTHSQSTMFADVLVTQLSQSTRLIGNTHRRAGYYVLLAPDVPAVLLELGFLSNAADEKLLKTSSHRKKMMKSVVTAINQYFDHQKP